MGTGSHSYDYQHPLGNVRPKLRGDRSKCFGTHCSYQKLLYFFSILGLAFAQNNPMLSPHVLSLFAAEMIAPDYYDGYSSAAAAVDFLRIIKENQYSNEIQCATKAYEIPMMIKILEKFQALNPSHNELHQIILQFVRNKNNPKSENDIVLFEIGFFLHSMKCELSRGSRNTYIMKVYNTGQGISKYHKGKKVGNRIKYCPFLTFELSEQLLIDKNFIDGIFNVKFGPGTSDANLYGDVLCLMNYKDSKDEFYMTPQRTGSCSFSSFHAYFMNKLGADNYRRIKFILSLKLLEYQLKHNDFNFFDDREGLSKMVGKKIIQFYDKKNQKNVIFYDGSEDEVQLKYLHNEIIFNITNYNIALYETVLRSLYRQNFLLFKNFNSENYRKFSDKIEELKAIYKEKKQMYQIKHRFKEICHKVEELNYGTRIVDQKEKPLKVSQIIQYKQKLDLYSSILPDYNQSLENVFKDLETFLNDERVYAKTFLRKSVLFMSFMYSFGNILHEKIRKSYTQMKKKGFPQLYLSVANKAFDMIIEADFEDSDIKMEYEYERRKTSFLWLKIYFTLWKISVCTKYPHITLDKMDLLDISLNMFSTPPRKYEIDLHESTNTSERMFYSQMLTSSRMEEEIEMQDLNHLFLIPDIKLIYLKILYELYSKKLIGNREINVCSQGDLINNKIFMRNFVVYTLTYMPTSHNYMTVFDDLYYVFVEMFGRFKVRMMNVNMRNIRPWIVTSYSNIIILKNTYFSVDSEKVGELPIFLKYISPKKYYTGFASQANIFENTILIDYYEQSKLYKNQNPIYNFRILPLSSFLSILSYLREHPLYIATDEGMYALYSLVLENNLKRISKNMNEMIPHVLTKIYYQALQDLEFNSSNESALKVLLRSYVALLRYCSTINAVFKNVILREFDYKKLIPKKQQCLFSFAKLAEMLIGQGNTNYRLDDIVEVYLEAISDLTLLSKYFLENEIFFILSELYRKYGNQMSNKVIVIDGLTTNVISGYNANVAEKISTYDHYPFSTQNSDILNYLSKLKLNNDNDHKIKLDYLSVLEYKKPILTVKYNKLSFCIIEGDVLLIDDNYKIVGKFVNQNKTKISTTENHHDLSKILGCKYKTFYVNSYKNFNQEIFVVLGDGTRYGRLYLENGIWKFHLEHVEAFCDPSLVVGKDSIFTLGNGSLEQIFEGKRNIDIITYGALTFNFSRGTDVPSLKNKNSTVYFFPSYSEDDHLNIFIIKYNDRLNNCWLVYKEKKYKIQNVKDVYIENRIPAIYFNDVKSGENFVIISKTVTTDQRCAPSEKCFIVKCDEKHYPKPGSILQRLDLISVLCEHKLYEEAFEFAPLISSSLYKYDEEESKAILRILENKHRDPEAHFFKAFAALRLQTNEYYFRTDDYTEIDYGSYYEKFESTFSLLPSYFFSITSSMLVNFNSVRYSSQFLDTFGVLSQDLFNKNKIEIQSPCLNTISWSVFVKSASTIDFYLNFIDPIKRMSALEAEQYFFNLKNELHFACTTRCFLLLNEMLLKVNAHCLHYQDNNRTTTAEKALTVVSKVLFTLLNFGDVEENKEKLLKSIKNATADYSFSRTVFSIYSDLISSIFNSRKSQNELIHSRSLRKYLLQEEDEIKLEPTKSEIFEKRLAIKKWNKKFLNTLLVDKEMLDDSFKNTGLDNLELSVKKNHCILFNSKEKVIDKRPINKQALLKLLLSADKEDLKQHVNTTNVDIAYEYVWRLFISEYSKSPNENVELDDFQKILYVYDHYSGLEDKIREDQKEALKIIIDNLKQGKSIIYQKMMGGGKTSVLGPCISLYATHILKKVPVFIFPTSLINQFSLNMTKFLWHTFGKRFVRIHMKRSKEHYDIDYLKMMLFQLEYSLYTRDAIICEPQTIQSLQNSRKEMLDRLISDEGGKNYPECLILVNKILKFIYDNTLFIVDEIDTVMNLTKSLNFNASKAAIHNNEEAMFLVDILFQISVKFPEYYEINRKMNDDEFNKFRKNVLKIMMEMDNRYSITENKEYEYIEQRIIPLWMRQRNVNYGLSHKRPILFIIPYSTSNTPSESSNFANFFITLGLTVKYYLENPIKELPLFFKEKGEIELFSETMERNFKTREETLEFLNEIVRTEKLFKEFFAYVVIPQIITYEHQYISNAYEFIRACKQFVGYSGTLFNMNVLKNISDNLVINNTEGSKIDSKISASFNVEGDKEYPKCVELKSENTLEEVIDILKYNDSKYKTVKMKSKKFVGLFDAGAILRDYSNEEFADAILELDAYKCVIYYDSKTNTLDHKVKKGIEKRHIDLNKSQFAKVCAKYKDYLTPDQVFIYLDTSHTIGADIELNDDTANCLTTVSSFMDTQQLYQAVLRARKLINIQSDERLENCQKITFLCKGIKPKNGQITYSQIKEMCDNNEIELNRRENSLIERSSVFSDLLNWLFSKNAYNMEYKESIQTLNSHWCDLIEFKNLHVSDYRWILYNEKPSLDVQLRLKAGKLPFFENFPNRDYNFDKIFEVTDIENEYEIEIEHEKEKENHIENAAYNRELSPYQEQYKVNVIGKPLDIYPNYGILKVHLTENFIKVSDLKSENSGNTLCKYPMISHMNDFRFMSMYDVDSLNITVYDFLWCPHFLDIYSSLTFAGLVDIFYFRPLEKLNEELISVLIFSGVYRSFIDFDSLIPLESLNTISQVKFIILMVEVSIEILEDSRLTKALIFRMKRWNNLESLKAFRKDSKNYNRDKGRYKKLLERYKAHLQTILKRTITVAKK